MRRIKLDSLTFLIACGALGAGALAACGNGGTPDAATDTAPVDTGGNAEAGPDAALEAGPDATVEAGPMEEAGAEAGPEAGPDAGPDASPDAAPMLAARVTGTQGSAMVLSENDRVGVGVNRTAGSVSVFRVSLPGEVARTANLDLGADSEPWAAVLSTDGNTAYVTLRHERQVVKITNLDSTPVIATTRANTGSEPTGIAISPTGRRIYVANWAEGTVTEVNTADMTVVRTIDLNPVLAGLGVLGPSVTATTARLGLAHPRALVVTNSGDTNDDDETVYVTEFFSQARLSGAPTDDAQFDVGRQGLVYRINAGTGAANTAVTFLAPVTDTGFQDSVPATTGCFPNQLNAVAINNGRLYVSSVCESPRGPTGPVVSGTPAVTNPANFKTQIHAVISVVNIASNAETEAERVLLTKRFDDKYNAAMLGAGDAARRMPLIVTDLQFVPGASVLYATSYGSDAVYRVRFGMDNAVAEVGSSVANFINLAPGGSIAAGRLPVGFAASNTMRGQRALVLNENSRNVSLLDLNNQVVIATAESHAAPAAGSATAINDGRRFFFTGLGRWSLNGQGWNSCGTCHPDGLTDNVTWFFARGPRQTTSLDGTFSSDGANQRVLNWTGIFDEIHDFENNTRGNSGGVGAVVHRASTPPTGEDRIIFDGAAPTGAQQATGASAGGLNGSVRAILNPGVAGTVPTTMVRSTLTDWDAVESYVKTIRPPRRPVGLVEADVAAGRMLFASNNCAACHGGALWTTGRLFFAPNTTVNAPMGLLRTMNYTLPAASPIALNPPANNAMRQAPLRFTARDALGMLDTTAIAANDQINCILRAVGTFPATGTVGVAPAGVTVKEVRANMMTAAQGTTGFNPPATVGMATGAPYFHAGNARTLEELFTETFSAHYTALSVNFLTGGDASVQRRQIIAFLQSIDDDASVVPTRGDLPYEPALCPTMLAP